MIVVLARVYIVKMLIYFVLVGQCDCSSSCVGFGDCCSDYSSVCSVQV